MSRIGLQPRALGSGLAVAACLWGAALSAQLAPAPPGEPPVVVEVRGEPRGAGTPALSRAQARELPGAFGDPLRAVDAIPGVVPTISGLPIFFIRGAPPASVGYVVDGVEVPLLFHAFLGPSVLHPGSLSGVVLESAPADVRYGGAAGAVIVAEPAAPSTSFRGEGSLRLFDAGALLATPFSAGEGSALVSGRYSFTGLLYSALTEEEFGYWDYQLRATRNLSRHDSIGVFAFGAGDHYGGEALAGAVGGDTGFHRVDLRLVHVTPQLSAIGAITFGRDRTSDATSSLSDRSLRARSEVTLRLSPTLDARWGADARLNRVDLEVASDRLDRGDLLELFPSRSDHSLASHASLSWRPERSVRIQAGLRGELYSSQGEHATSLDPRFSFSVRLMPRVSMESRFGVASQKPNFVPGVPAAQVGSLERGLTRGRHASSTLRLTLPADVSLSAGGFQSHYDNVVDPLGQAREFRLDRNSLERRQDITARGFEFRLGRPLTRNVGGFVAYTLSWAVRQSERERTPSGYDRRHVLQGALAVELWWKLRASARGLYYSGFPALEIGDDGALPSQTLRAPGFFRLDWRVERPFRVSDRLELSVVAEMLNATAAKEALRYECGGRCELVTAGPIVLPSIGLEATY